MPGVGDQPRLPLPRFGQRPQHQVERLGEAGQFVAAEHRDGSQVVGARDAFGRFGQATHRAQAGPGDHATRDRGDGHADPADDQQHPAQFVHHRLGRLEALGDQQRGAVLQVDGEDPLIAGRTPRHEQFAVDDRLLRRTDRQGLTGLLGGVDGVARIHQNRVDVRIGGAFDRLAGVRGKGTAGDQQLGPALQLVVDVAVERGRNHSVDGERHQHHDHGDHRHRQQHDPPPQRQRRGRAQRWAHGWARRPGELDHRGDCIVTAVSPAGRNPPRARCGSAGTHRRLRFCGAGSPRRPPAHCPRWGSRTPIPPRGCGCG